MNTVQIPDFKILKDSKKNAELVKNGFITLPAIEKDGLAYFKELYKKWHPEPPTAFYKSYFSNNQQYKVEVENAIIEHCKEGIANHFCEDAYSLFGAMFVVKPPNDLGQIPPHQDWSFVDETKHWSLNMWLPLQDVGERNGTLRFIKGSHLFRKTIRGANTPEWYDNLYPIIEENLIDVPVNAGEAIFFFHGSIHTSHYNYMAEERVCLGLSMVQKNVPIYFHLLKENEIYADKYLVNTDFYMEYASSRGQIPKNVKHIGNEILAFQKMEEEMFGSVLKLF